MPVLPPGRHAERGRRRALQPLPLVAQERQGQVEALDLTDLGCGGVLKPDVIFFGENVPRDRVAERFALTETASLLLELGSSLTAQSG